MRKIEDNTPIAMLTVGELKKILSIDKILGNVPLRASPANEIMTIDEVAKLTGYSKATIYKFTHSRTIPFYKPANGGRRLCFNRTEILDWMQNTSVETIEQYCNEKLNHFTKNKNL